MSIRIYWECDNEHTDISLHKSFTPISVDNLPHPIATNLKNEYLDPADTDEAYYIVSSYFEGNVFLSSQVSTEALKDGIFVIDLAEKYISPSANQTNFNMLI